jgi:alkylhydroperoxidase family enzyme
LDWQSSVSAKGIVGALARAIAVTRRNHALEHATVHILSRSSPTLRVVGRTTYNGFYLYGNLPASAVEAAAKQAVLELQSHPELAVHPRCGTNLAVMGLAAGTAAYIAGGVRTRHRIETLPQVLLASLLALLAAQPLGAVVQERFTTSPRVAGARIGTVRRIQAGNVIGHFVPVSWD